ncbi:NAD(P)(+) transhydrogenase (Re/Si-specific) subunit beta [Shigella flexneri]
MAGGLVTAAYIVAAIPLFLVWRGFRNPKRLGRVSTGIAGMAIVLMPPFLDRIRATLAGSLAMVIGGAIGIRLAKKVEMTEMPELVAILHSFVGVVAVLVGFNSYLHHDAAWNGFW